MSHISMARAYADMKKNLSARQIKKINKAVAVNAGRLKGKKIKKESALT